MTRYSDLEISIGREDAKFRVRGQDYSGKHGITDDVLAELEQLRRTGQPDEYGKRLFEALFVGRLHDGIVDARTETKRGVSWRVRLNIDRDSVRLNQLWWECLHDPSPPPQTMGMSMDTPLSRYLEGGATRNVQASRLKVLVVIANPEDLGKKDGRWRAYRRLQDDEEQKTILGALDNLGDRIDYEVLDPPATTGAIFDKLRTGEFHVVHVVAHGAEDLNNRRTALLLENQDRTAALIGQVELGRLFAVRRTLRLVVLAACRGAWLSGQDVFTGLAPLLVEYGTPAVIAMQDPVPETTAMLFTQKFYEALARWSDETGGMVDVAMNEAREALYYYAQNDKKVWDWAIPVLFLRGKGRLFRIEAPSADREPDRVERGALGGLKGPTAPPVTAGSDSDKRLRDRGRLFDQLTLDPGLEPVELDLITTLFWDCKFDDLAGDGLEGKATELIRRAEHDELDLAARIRAAMKLREKREQRLAQASGSVAASAGKVPWSGPSDRLP